MGREELMHSFIGAIHETVHGRKLCMWRECVQVMLWCLTLLNFLILYSLCTTSALLGTLIATSSCAFLADPTSVLSLSLNSAETTDLKVNVSETVTLTCRADGRPTPKMDLTRPSGDVIASVSQGTPLFAEEIKEVTGDITVQCRDTGVYSCDVNNGVGSIQQQHVTIFVQCKFVCH